MINNDKGPKEVIIDEIKKEIIRMIKGLGHSLADVKEAFKQLSLDTFWQAWNYTEVEQDTYSFKELLSWVKEHLNQNLHSGASITREEKVGVGIILSCCFMDKRNTPMTSLKDPFLRVIAKKLDEDLTKNFGDKNMIVLH
ncbi:hypothetical protein [Helicobacter labacensis]|uniref:hypothetical protein n=1 Tax=Helicobacter labacensis TaxID=2316079 RepID=UPI000EAB4FEE|nr:hypothetical protein [Helicobacter labacensis]